MRLIDVEEMRALPLFRGVAAGSVDAMLHGAFLQRFPAHVELAREGEPADPVQGRRQVERDVVAAPRADLDTVDAEDARVINRRGRLAGAVPVVGEDDELDVGACGSGGYDLG